MISNVIAIIFTHCLVQHCLNVFAKPLWNPKHSGQKWNKTIKVLFKHSGQKLFQTLPSKDHVGNIEGQDADRHGEVRRRQTHDEKVGGDLERGIGEHRDYDQNISWETEKGIW